MGRPLWISAATVLAGVTALGWSLAAQAGAEAEPPAVIALTQEAASMLWLDPPSSESATPPGGTSQAVSVRIEPGPLLLIEPPGTIRLRRVDGTSRFEATLTGLRLADARGTDAGWQLRMHLERVNGEAHRYGELHVSVRRIDGFAETIEGISAATPFDLSGGESAVVAEAVPGSGQGCWDVTLDVSAELPHVDAEVVTARVRFETA